VVCTKESQQCICRSCPLIFRHYFPLRLCVSAFQQYELGFQAGTDGMPCDGETCRLPTWLGAHAGITRGGLVDDATDALHHTDQLGTCSMALKPLLNGKSLSLDQCRQIKRMAEDFLVFSVEADVSLRQSTIWSRISIHRSCMTNAASDGFESKGVIERPHRG
jgi:hypothetical protein